MNELEKICKKAEYFKNKQDYTSKKAGNALEKIINKLRSNSNGIYGK